MRNLSMMLVPALAAALLAIAGSVVAAEGSGSVPPRLLERLKAMDTDGDGAISKAEFLANAERRFQQLDTNHDDVVTAEELRAVRANRLP